MMAAHIQNDRSEYVILAVQEGVIQLLRFNRIDTARAAVGFLTQLGFVVSVPWSDGPKMGQLPMSG